MRKTEYDEGAQYKEALNVEQNAPQRETEMELEEKGDLKCQWTEVDKRRNNRKTTTLEKNFTHRSNHKTQIPHCYCVHLNTSPE
eukprot:779904-Ditylum_brightwellii.AAC.1